MNPKGTDTLFARPPERVELGDCSFYHTIELPGIGLISGAWDLRGGVDEYLGNVPLQGARVIEIGPASGFLTVEMEKRGASVVAVEITDDHAWDFVPYPPPVLSDEVRAWRIAGMRMLKNSFWLTHHAYRSRAKVFYGDAGHLPDELGSFDVALIASVLQHVQAPLQIVSECAKRAKKVIITTSLWRDLEGQGPICRLHPTEENRDWDSWWHFSTSFFAQFLGVMGYRDQRITFHTQEYHDARGIHHPELFTIVASC